jgi:hypothetical protein
MVSTILRICVCILYCWGWLVPSQEQESGIPEHTPCVTIIDSSSCDYLCATFQPSTVAARSLGWSLTELDALRISQSVMAAEDLCCFRYATQNGLRSSQVCSGLENAFTLNIDSSTEVFLYP